MAVRRAHERENYGPIEGLIGRFLLRTVRPGHDSGANGQLGLRLVRRAHDPWTRKVSDRGRNGR